MRIMKQKLILFLLSVTMPFCVMAAELGDDGLHKQSWMRDTFKDLREDLDEANSEGKRLYAFSNNKYSRAAQTLRLAFYLLN